MRTPFYHSCMLLFIGTLLCASCTSSREEKITRLVTEWQNREILLPPNAIFTIQGKDTIKMNTDADHKILVYVDSAGCTSCRLQLHKWIEFKRELDSLTNKPVRFLFFLSPKSIIEARYITRRDDFTYPMCIDIEDKLGHMNNFPDEEMFHTYLLDADNKVQIIGNPIHNNAIRSLYIETITNNHSEKEP